MTENKNPLFDILKNVYAELKWLEKDIVSYTHITIDGINKRRKEIFNNSYLTHDRINNNLN